MSQARPIRALLAVGIMTVLLIGNPSLLSAQNSNMETAAEMFKAKCASCHGSDGAAKNLVGIVLRIPDLRSGEVQKQSDEQLKQVISKGKNKMPAFENRLGKEQIELLIPFIRQMDRQH